MHSSPSPALREWVSRRERVPTARSSRDRCRRLRHSFPKLAVMSEHDPRAGRLTACEFVERSVHRVAVVDPLREAPLAQRAAKVTGICGEHDVTRSEPHDERLMAGRVTVGRQADDAAIAKQVVLALDLDDLVAEIEIGAVEAALRGDAGSSRPPTRAFAPP